MQPGTSPRPRGCTSFGASEGLLARRVRAWKVGKITIGDFEGGVVKRLHDGRAVVYQGGIYGTLRKRDFIGAVEGGGNEDSGQAMNVMENAETGVSKVFLLSFAAHGNWSRSSPADRVFVVHTTCIALVVLCSTAHELLCPSFRESAQLVHHCIVADYSSA